jgi:hypothetical protein
LNPPNTFSDQKRWYPGDFSLMKKWIWRITSRPASQISHCESRSWISAASLNGSSGLSAIDAHTMISQAMTNNSSSRTRSHSDIRLRVAAFGLRWGSVGGGAAAPGASATGAVTASPAQ